MRHPGRQKSPLVGRRHPTGSKSSCRCPYHVWRGVMVAKPKSYARRRPHKPEHTVRGYKTVPSTQDIYGAMALDENPYARALQAIKKSNEDSQNTMATDENAQADAPAARLHATRNDLTAVLLVVLVNTLKK